MEMMEVGTPKGVDVAATGRYDDDVISKQERANDDRTIMYAKRGRSVSYKQGKAMQCNAMQSKGLTLSIAEGSEEHEMPTRAYLRIFA